jgi:translation initiation factor 2 beta subunit (eIF-2beta)/eIF-5
MPSDFNTRQIWVGGSSDDPHYRYKVPAVTSRHQSKGSYVKTLLINFPTVVKAVGEFYGQADKKLMFNFVSKSLKAGGDPSKMVLNGEFTPQRINKALCQYFDFFVCCPACSNPETKCLTSKRRKRVYIICATCGHKGKLSREATECAYSKAILRSCKADDSLVKEIKRNLAAQAQANASNEQSSSKTKVSVEQAGDDDDSKKQPDKMSHAEALEAFLRLQERKPQEIVEQVELLTLSRALDPTERWAMLCNAIFSSKQLADIKDIMLKVQKYSVVIRHYTDKAASGKADAMIFLSYLCWLTCQRIAAVPVILSHAIACQAISAKQVLLWGEHVSAKPIPKWRGVARYGIWEASPEHMLKVKDRCAELMEFLKEKWPDLIKEVDGDTNKEEEQHSTKVEE